MTKQMNDGWENLRRAITEAPVAAPGVYLEMGQGLWDADSVTKHVQTENDRPDTKVRHSEFQRLDPERTRDVRFWRPGAQSPVGSFWCRRALRAISS